MSFLRFTLRQLETFLTVAETHSFTDASERLGLTPSAVSQLVQELETVLGFRVFDRSTRRVSLSATGKEFMNSAGAVLKRARQAEILGQGEVCSFQIVFKVSPFGMRHVQYQLTVAIDA